MKKARFLAMFCVAAIYAAALWYLDRLDDAVATAIENGDNPENVVDHMDGALREIAWRGKTIGAGVFAALLHDWANPYINLEDVITGRHQGNKAIPESVRIAILGAWVAILVLFVWAFSKT